MQEEYSAISSLSQLIRAKVEHTDICTLWIGTGISMLECLLFSLAFFSKLLPNWTLLDISPPSIPILSDIRRLTPWNFGAITKGPFFAVNVHTCVLVGLK